MLRYYKHGQIHCNVVYYHCSLVSLSVCVLCPALLVSLQASDPKFATQEMVYNDIGKEMLHHAFEG